MQIVDLASFRCTCQGHFNPCAHVYAACNAYLVSLLSSVLIVVAVVHFTEPDCNSISSSEPLHNRWEIPLSFIFHLGAPPAKNTSEEKR